MRAVYVQAPTLAVVGVQAETSRRVLSGPLRPPPPGGILVFQANGGAAPGRGDLMSQRLYVNLPVRSLSEAERFYLGFGLKKDERYSDQNASAIQITDTVSVMLLTTPFFEQFLREGDTAHVRSHQKEVLNALELKSRAEVERWCVLAVSHGGTVYRPGAEQYGMFSAAIADPDGHVWELMPAMDG